MGHSFIVGFSYAIRAVRNIVDSYISRGSTTNLCAIDLSKAFDKVNHDALFLQELSYRKQIARQLHKH